LVFGQYCGVVFVVAVRAHAKIGKSAENATRT